MAYGIDPVAGFVKKPLEAIHTDIGDAQKAVFGEGWDTSYNSAEGQLNGTWASALAECWELLEALYHGADPDAAAGALLTILAGLTGTPRRGAAASISRRQQFTINAGATLPSGMIVKHSARDDITFIYSGAAVTNGTGSAADFVVEMSCQKTGPVQALAGTLTAFVTPASGVTATTNLDDVELGRNVDSDILLRQRREDQLALRGGSTLAAIKADLLAITNMRDVKMLENVTDSAVDGIGAHSYEALIDDGDTPSVANNTIAQALWDSRPAGVYPSGSSSGTATDADGDTHAVPFSRVTLRPVYIVLSLTTDGDFPGDGAAQVKAKIVEAGAAYGIEKTVLALQLRAACLAVAGVLDVPTFQLGFAPAPVGTSNLAPGSRARATFSSLNISIV